MLCNNCGALNVSYSSLCSYCHQNIDEGLAHPRLSVLVVEDDDEIRGLLCKWLEGADLKIDDSADGRDALSKFSDNKYDIAIIDVDIPFIDGITLSRTFKAKRPNFPIIICTAYVNALSQLEIAEAEADSFISKPFDLDQMLLEIQRLTFGGLEPE